MMYNLNARTFRRWRSNATRFDFIPPDHALIGREHEHANRTDPHLNAVVRKLIVNAARAEGHPLPIGTSDAYQRDLFGLDEDVEHETFLPPYLSMRVLHRMFLQKYPELDVSWSTFYRMLSATPNVHVSKRERGLCDSCFIMRQKIRTLQTQARLDATAKFWHRYISDAEVMRMQYTDMKGEAKEEWKKETQGFLCYHLTAHDK